MRPQDLLQETVSAVTANKARSGLTVLGIIIGIASVIAMVSIGEGAKGSIEASIQGLGSNLLTISPGAQQQGGGRGFVSGGRGSSQTLTAADAAAVADITGVAHVSPELQQRFQLVSQVGNNTSATVIGATDGYAPVRAVEVEKGSFLGEQHSRGAAKVAVLGPTVAVDLFGEDEPVGKTVRIDRTTFKVIGVLKAKGGTGFFNPDETVIVPLTTMQNVLSGDEHVSSIAVAVEEKELMASVKEEATALLLQRHKVAEADFSIISQEDILGALTQVTTTFTLFLASIAGISLVVGGIGIMNMMLTAVTERTREIGLRKAVGARRRVIELQFLAESVMLTFIGGALGILLGWGVAVTVSQLAGIATKVSLNAVGMAFGVSAVIGIVFGYYPARRASGLDPIVALRYE